MVQEKRLFKSIVQLIPLESGEVIVDKTSIKNRTDYNKNLFHRIRESIICKSYRLREYASSGQVMET